MANPTADDLMYAILAMDSYNRGDGASLEYVGLNIAQARVENIEVDDSAWQSAGFYAVAYQWNGETIISYRGDEPRICIRTCQAFLKLGLIFFEASKLKPQKRHKKGAVKAP